MTLFKQIALLVSLVFLIFVLVTTLGDFRRSSEYLEGQLQTSAQDIATTLGISISNSGIGSDRAALGALFNSVFDSGYYTKIELVDSAGELIHKKEQSVEIRSVPAWFVSMVPLKEATGTSQIMQGWVPLGTLSITVHPGFTYVSLYHNLRETLVWVIGLFVIGMVLLWFLLHKILKPLSKVREQAEAIRNNQFVTQPELPSTPELRRVVESMNGLVGKVQGIFNDQQRALANYQDLLYQDKLTGLGNRKYLLNQFEQAQSEDAVSYNAMALLKVTGLKELRNTQGYLASDKLVRYVADLMKAYCLNDEANKCARLGEDEFAVLDGKDTDVLKEHIESLFDEFRTKNENIADSADISLVAGITHIYPEMPVGDIFSNLDFSLNQSLSKGAYSIVESTRVGVDLPQGKMQWRSWLEEAIAAGRLYLASQPVVNKLGEEVQQEVFVRLKSDQNETIPAGLFMPMALSLGLGLDIDKMVFKLLSKISLDKCETPIAINLTASFLDSHCYISREFSQLLAAFEGASCQLCFEVSHNVFNKHEAMCAQVADRVRHLGHAFGVDNLDIHSSMDVLQSIRPSYVKINASALTELTPEDVSSGYTALRTMIDTMDIQFIAVAVGSQEVYDHLTNLGIDVMQGNFIAEPKELS